LTQLSLHLIPNTKDIKSELVITKRVIVDYKNVPDEVLQALSAKYPHGFGKDIITFKNAKGELVTAVPIEMNETMYLVKVSTQLQNMVDNYEDDEFSELIPSDIDVDLEDVEKREKTEFEDDDEGEDSYGDMEDFDDVADDEGDDDDE
jgi:hypothetical protein